jgi:acylphosphatase
MEEKLLYRIYVSGRVQGVGYRWSAVREARRKGITGYVKNLPDGRVYIEAEGTRRQLEEFVDWCMKGPGIGFVQSVITDIYPPVNYRNFDVEY